MVAWFESVVGPEYAPAAMWTAIAIAVLIVLLIILRLLRGLSGGTFVMGGRNRKARLAVMDATAVDQNRRLVLVRRDDVEHLILIGGPTDVVVEQNIRLMAPARSAPAEQAAPLAPPIAHRPAEAAAEVPASRQQAVSQEAQPQRAPAPVAAQPAPVQRPVQPAPQRAETPAPRPQPQPVPAPPVAAVAPPVAPPVQREVPQPTARVEPQRAEPTMEMPQQQQTRVAPQPERTWHQPAPQVAPAIEPASLDANIATARPISTQPNDRPARTEEELSLEEEMSRLLGDLSAPRR